MRLLTYTLLCVADEKSGYTDADEEPVGMTTVDGDGRSPNGTASVFDVTMDHDMSPAGVAGAAGQVRLVHIHKHDDEPMVSVCDPIRSDPIHSPPHAAYNMVRMAMRGEGISA